MTGTATIIRGNALHLPLADASVDLICTSPPYFGLRSYQDGGEHYAGQIGSEATPAEFVDALIAATREMVRVLKPSGSIFVNLGDKYSGAQQQTSGRQSGMTSAEYWALTNPKVTGVKAKSLMGIPWRYAIRCIDDLGLILRAEVIWSKPNGLPESVTDRVRRSHEQWFHFVKEPRYFSAVDEIREEHATLGRESGPRVPRGLNRSTPSGHHQNGMANGELGKLPGSVWTIDGGDSLVRSVLTAVSEGGITVEEGERILAWTSYGSGPTWRPATAAGNGLDYSTLTDTRDITRSTSSLTGQPASPTRLASDPSPTGSPSTTSAATGHASDQNTSSPSPTESTADADHDPVSAPQDTTTTTPTHTCEPTANANAVSAWPSERDSREQPNGPPSVWVIPTQPLQVPAWLGIDHFAAFPMEWPRRIIQGWSPAGVCTVCGEGRRPVLMSERTYDGEPIGAGVGGIFGSEKRKSRNKGVGNWHFGADRAITGYACACPEPTAHTRPSVILDPFGGTGTVALMAKALGRHGITVDMSGDYCRLAKWRTTDRAELARAMQVETTPDAHSDQLDLFGDGAA